MFRMFNQIFTAIALMFSAVEKVAQSANNLADIGVEMSASYAEEQRILRLAKSAALKLEHSVA